MSEPIYDAQDAAIADLSEQRRDCMLALEDARSCVADLADKLDKVECERDVWKAKVPTLAKENAELRSRARDLLKLLPDNLPSNELYAAVDNLSALIPVE